MHVVSVLIPHRLLFPCAAQSATATAAYTLSITVPRLLRYSSTPSTSSAFCSLISLNFALPRQTPLLQQAPSYSMIEPNQHFPRRQSKHLTAATRYKRKMNVASKTEETLSSTEIGSTGVIRDKQKMSMQHEAVHQVLEMTELLEMIMLYLPVRELLHDQRVCKT